MEGLVITSMSSSDRYLERKIAGLCTRCGQPAADGVQMCEPCRKIAKERTRASMAKIYVKRKAAKLCVDCGKKRPSGDIRCHACRVRRGRIPKYAVTRKTIDLNRNLNQGGDLAARRLELESDGKSRYRFHGRGERGERGRYPAVELDAQDLKEAARALEQGGSGIGYYWSPDVQELSKTQKSDVRTAALDKLELCKRWIDEVLIREGRLEKPDDPADDDEDSE